MISARQPGPQIVLEAAEVMAQGGMVAMLADRTYRQEAAVEVDFLGRARRSRFAPLAIAAALDVPVFPGFSVFYEGKRRYRLVFDPLPSPGPLSSQPPRKARSIEPMGCCVCPKAGTLCKSLPLQLV